MKLNKYLTEYDEVEASDEEKKEFIKKAIDEELDEIFARMNKILHPPGTRSVNKALMKFAIDYLKKEASGKMPRW
jgi:superfamily II helicase